MKCEYKKPMRGPFGKYKKRCDKDAVTTDCNGRNLCLHHKNRHDLKLSKTAPKC